MKLNIHKYDKSELISELPRTGLVREQFVQPPSVDDLRATLSEKLKLSVDSQAAVVATDLYQYSRKDTLCQIIIPGILKDLHRQTVEVLQDYERFLFDPQFYDWKLKEKAIPRKDTGDGGFAILATPLHALLYVIWHEIFVHFFNTYHLTPEARSIVGPLTIRYAISYDTLVNAEDLSRNESDFYGPAIIKAARIVARDKLNRWLIDDNTFDWFLEVLSGIENIQFLDALEVQRILNKKYQLELSEKSGDSILTNHPPPRIWGIRSCDVLHVGKSLVKESNIDIHSLCIQAVACMVKTENENDEEVKTVATIGNLNTVGLN